VHTGSNKMRRAVTQPIATYSENDVAGVMKMAPKGTLELWDDVAPAAVPGSAISEEDSVSR
jgi:hypothetical protein